ncbi:acyltransferase family protein [Microtetraspora sp. NBRC 16547]|uniref:acyltransferase family protein n=1 Tax=Microtetraspora sp. NBRC 16547 TaxID=3030993 RepID=UPI00249FBC73|nr:acyltransferase family protein [Microtetraspora sp. NBRC 16547]GLW96041.1 hypothetical protein Misp02_01280 [Microtetraspora sp. NBRC 16547]
MIGRITGEWPPPAAPAAPAARGGGTPTGAAPASEAEPPVRQAWADPGSAGGFAASQDSPPSTGHFASFGSPATPPGPAGPAPSTPSAAPASAPPQAPAPASTAAGAPGMPTASGGPAASGTASADAGQGAGQDRPLPKRKPRSPRAGSPSAAETPEPATQSFDYFSTPRTAGPGAAPASDPLAASPQSSFDGTPQSPFAAPTPDSAAPARDPLAASAQDPFAAPVQDPFAAPAAPEALPKRPRRGSAEGQAPTQAMPAVPAAPAQQWPELPADPWDPWRRADHDVPQGLAVPSTVEPPPAAPPAPAPTPPAPDPLPLPAWAQAPQQASPYGPGPVPGFGATGWEELGPEEEEEPAPQPKRQREPYLDNVKFLLIALVVTGHALRPTVDVHANRALYIFMYAFHMPLFVMISGYLSRNFWNSNAKTNKLVDTFLVPYVIVEFGYAALRFAFGHKWSVSITDPAWLNWYLIALLFWRLSTPVWKRMRYPLVAAVVVCLFSGLSQLNGEFSIDRVFGLLPFFVMGLVLKPEHFDLLKRTPVRIAAALVLVTWAVAAYLMAPRLKLSLWYFNASYHDLHMTWWYGMGFRLVFLTGVTVLCFSVMALVPRRRTWFSDLGTRTLYCYLLHGVPVMIGKEMGWLKAEWLDGPLGVAAIVSGSFALAIILCLPITRTLFKWMLEPRLTWLYRRPRKIVDQQPEVQR